MFNLDEGDFFLLSLVLGLFALQAAVSFFETWQGNKFSLPKFLIWGLLSILSVVMGFLPYLEADSGHYLVLQTISFLVVIGIQAMATALVTGFVVITLGIVILLLRQRQ